jgi:hypothetical protein
MVAVVIVCHKGDLELKTAFLIHTIRKYLTGNFIIYVGIPDEGRHIMPPSLEFVAYCENSGVHIYHFSNIFLNNRECIRKGDLISNKLFALQHTFEEEYVMFLDSDTAFLREINTDELVRDTLALKVRPAGRANVNNWGLIYKSAHLPMPEKRVVTSVDRVKMPPYFNSGVIVFRKEVLNDFIKSWIHYFKWLSDSYEDLKFDFPLFHRDQISLSLAICSCEIEYSILDEALNYPVRGKKINKNSPPFIVHYHHAYSVYYERILNREFLGFIGLNPQFIDTAGILWKNLFAETIIKRKSVALLESMRYTKYKAKQYIKIKRNHLRSYRYPAKNE